MAPRTPPMIGTMSIPSERAPKTGEADKKTNSKSQIHKTYQTTHGDKLGLHVKSRFMGYENYHCAHLISRALRVFTLACAEQRRFRRKVRACARGRGEGEKLAAFFPSITLCPLLAFCPRIALSFFPNKHRAMRTF